MISTTIPAVQQLAVALFDVELDGGGSGEHPMRGDLLPAGAVVLDALARIDAPFVTAKPGSALSARMIPTLSIQVGGRRIIPTLSLSNQTWRAGAVKRSELAATGAVAVCHDELAVTAAIEPPGGGGYARGALTVLVTYVVVP